MNRTASAFSRSSPMRWPKRVVDILEAVEIEKGQGHDLAMDAGGQNAVDQFDHLAVIGQTGEHVLDAPASRRVARLPTDRAPRAAPARARCRQNRPGICRSSPAAAVAGRTHCSWIVRAARRTSRRSDPGDRPPTGSRDRRNCSPCRLALEAQVLDADDALDRLDVAGIERGRSRRRICGHPRWRRAAPRGAPGPLGRRPGGPAHSRRRCRRRRRRARTAPASQPAAASTAGVRAAADRSMHHS